MSQDDTVAAYMEYTVLETELRGSPAFLKWKPRAPRRARRVAEVKFRTVDGRKPVAATTLAHKLETVAVIKEKHYSPQELADVWGVSVQTIREIFRAEQGVLKIGSNGTRTRRGYKTLRIPESVVERVHTRLSS